MMSTEEADIEKVVNFENVMVLAPKGLGLVMKSECAYIYKILEDVESFKSKMDAEISKRKRYSHYHEGSNCLMLFDIETRNKLQITFEKGNMIVYPFKNCIPSTIKDLVMHLKKMCLLEYDSMWKVG